MNKAITDGLVLMPPEFAAGLTVWSSENGTPGSNTYDGAANAAFVPADQDFGGCLELTKTQSVQKLRWMGDTPILPGCYLMITAKVKAISGNLPDVRIAGWAGGAGNAHVAGLPETGPSVTLTTYGEVVTVRAIVGTGTRTGVDMPWGTAAVFGHFGLDLTGPNGGVVRIDDIKIEDATNVFYRKLMDWVDVVDYGAIGDGVTDNKAAFDAADAAANGREVLISKGTFYLADHVTLNSKARFEGTVVMPADKRLALIQNFDLDNYVKAFGNEVLGFKKAWQAMLNFSDHDSLDLNGRRIEIDAPIDMQAAVGNKTTYEVRRTVRNGQFDVTASTNWDTDTLTSQASYSASAPLTLSGVTNIASIPVGARVSGNGVGREVYVRAVNVGAGTLTLSRELYDAVGTQIYTFERYKYVLDFSGFTKLSKLAIENVEFLCNGEASAIMLATDGQLMHIRDCFFTKPKDRAITSHGIGCQGMLIDRCRFLSNEQALRAQDRTTVAFNANQNDIKLRDNMASKFAHFGFLCGTGNVVTGNHWFQGDSEPNGLRQAGLIFTAKNLKSTIIGNYVDNNFIEINNEHDSNPDFASELSFGGLSITGNIFTANDVADWFNWIVIKPYGASHFIQGLIITGNTFRSLNGTITRVESVDTTFNDLNYNMTRNVVVQGNTFNGITNAFQSPVSLEHTQNTDSLVWTIDFAPYLPFGGYARKVTGLVSSGKITTGANTRVNTMPYTTPLVGPNLDQVKLTWNLACRGKVMVTARVDKPV